MSGTTESSDEYLIIIIDETHATILWHVGSNFLVVLFELNSDTLTDSRVRLLSFDTDLLNDNTSSVRGSSEGLLPSSILVSLFVALIGPSVKTSLDTELASSPNS